MKHRHNGKYRSRTPKGFIVYKRRPIHKHKLSKEYRSIFQRLDKKPYETGGYMDFNKKGLERADIYIGRKASVDIDVTPDKEIEYHTHIKNPDKIGDRLHSFPSKWDIKDFKEFPSQSMIVFHDNKAMVTTKTDKFKVNEKKLDKLYSGLRKDYPTLSTDKLYKKYRPKYKDLGLDVKYIKHDKAIRLPISIVEPKYKSKKLGKQGIFFGEPEEFDFEKDLEKYKEEKELKLNLPIKADPEEIEKLTQEQIEAQTSGELKEKRREDGYID